MRESLRDDSCASSVEVGASGTPLYILSIFLRALLKVKFYYFELR